MTSTSTAIEIEGRRLSLSNLGKVMYPASGFTKAQVIDYYSRISPVLLPHLRAHPLTLKRYPDGVEGEFFFEKNCPSHRPPWVQTTVVRGSGGTTEYCLAEDLPTLVWIANLASLELHPGLALVANPSQPTVMVFDLDPGAPADIVDCARVALRLRDLFEQMGLATFAKTSGSKGLQVYVPLNTPVTYNETKSFSRAVAQMLERQPTSGVVSSMSKALRPGKVFLDWSQNDEHKTTVAVYSLRARARPTVSTPVNWDEVESASAGKPQSLVFESDAVLRRVERWGDAFGKVLRLRQSLPALKFASG